MSEVKEDREGAVSGGGEPLATPDPSITITNTDDGRVPAPARGPAPDLNLAGVTMTADPVSPKAPSLASPAGLPLLEVPLENYKMIGEQGRGGIGIVRRARDLRLDREVAIKELQRDSHQARQRFEREMRITAKLQHPGVVPVHEAGHWPDGSPFYTMKLVEGRSLKELVAERSTLEQRLTLLPHAIAVAETIAYSHSKGVIHRDLKPSNVIVGAFGETVVIDWGLAKDLNEELAGTPESGPYRTPVDSSLTATGAVMGTPAYMAPEQASGGDVDERTDVYALGALLLHVLLGRSPFSGQTPAHIIAHLETSEISLPASLDRHTELVAILRKAMRREPSARYSHAGQFADDLRAFVSGQLVSAHAYSPWLLARRWIRKNRLLVTAGTTMMLALLATLAISATRVIDARNRETEQRRIAEQRAARLAAANEGIRARTRQLSITSAARAISNDPALAILLLQEVPPGTDAAGAAMMRDIALEASRKGIPERMWKASGTPFLALSTDDSRLAIIDQTSLRIINVSDGASLGSQPWQSRATDYPMLLEWTSTEEVIAVTRHGVAALYAHGRLQYLDIGCDEVTSIDRDESAPLLFVGCANGIIRVLDTRGRSASSLGKHQGSVTGIASRAGLVVSVGLDRKVVWWSKSGAAIHRATIDSDGLPSRLAIGRDSTVYVGTSTGEVIAFCSTPTKDAVMLQRTGSRVTQLEETVDSQLVISTVHGITSITEQSGINRATISHAWNFALVPGWLVSADSDGTVNYYHLSTGWQRHVRAHPREIQSLVMTQSGVLFTAGADGSVRQWSSGMRPKAIVTLPFDGRYARLGPASTPDLVAVTGQNGEIGLYDVAGSQRAFRHSVRGRVFAQGWADRYISVAFEAGTVTHLDGQLGVLNHAQLGASVAAVGVALGEVAVATTRTATLLSEGLPEPIDLALGANESISRVDIIEAGTIAVGTSIGRSIVCSHPSACVSIGPPMLGDFAGIVRLGSRSYLRIAKSGGMSAIWGDRAWPLTPCGGPIFRLARDTGTTAWPCHSGFAIVSEGAARYRALVERPTDIHLQDGLAASRLSSDAVQFVRLDDDASALLPTSAAILDIVLFPAQGSSILLGKRALYFWDLRLIDWIPGHEAGLRTWIKSTVEKYEH